MQAAYPQPLLLIDGQWRDEGSAPSIDVENPSTGERLARMPGAGEREIEQALAAAARAFPAWRRVPPQERCALLLRAAGWIRERAGPLSITMSMEQGKPLKESQSEVLRAAEHLEWAAEEGRRTYGLTIPAPPDLRFTTYVEPIGVVAAFTPWNFPAVSPARKLGSTLAAGCCCILKPSELTPGTSIILVQALMHAGLPPGVVNLLLGDPRQISAALIASPIVRKVTFTGSVPVGKTLATLAAQHMKPCLMELGGHAPVIVAGDVDVDRVAAACVATKFRNAGQVCTSPTRFFVHADIYRAFVDRFCERAGRLVVGDALKPETEMGPVASERRVTSLESLVADAAQTGAKTLLGGHRRAGPGWFFEPTVLADVPGQARIVNEEPFGPVAVFKPYGSIEEALTQANALPYGLAAYAFTTSLRTARQVTEGLECGVVGLNSFSGSNPETPFGGVKDSGYGREGGTEGVRAYTITKFVVEGQP